MYSNNRDYIINPPVNYHLPLPQFSSKNNNYIFNNPDPNTLNHDNKIDYNDDGKKLGIYTHMSDYEPPNILDKNLHAKYVNQDVYEYPVLIDSVDRDITIYPNPFQYRVSLNSSSSPIAPFIMRNFEKVKYIKLETAVIPRLYSLYKTNISPITNSDLYTLLSTKITPTTTDQQIQSYLNTQDQIGVTTNYATYVNIQTTRQTSLPFNLTAWTIEVIINNDTQVLYVYEYPSNNFYTIQFDTYFDLSTDRNIILNMNEINNINVNSTNNQISGSFGVLYNYHKNNNFVFTDTSYVSKVYKPTELQNINRLSISFNDSSFKQLNTQLLNYSIDTPSNCICTVDSSGNRTIVYRCASHYIRHPYYKYLQNNILLKVGIYEPSINQLAFN